MLSAAHRLRDAEGFKSTTRRGERTSTRMLVVHLHVRDDSTGGDPQVGFVVSRQVGSAVVRNVVKRRLRHLVRPRIGLLPAGSALVIRAKPASAYASSDDLAAELDRALLRLRLDQR